MKKFLASLAIAVLLAAATGLTVLPAQAADQTVAIITFNASGGAGDLPEAMIGTSGSAAVVPAADLTGPAAENGLFFIGWAADAASDTAEYCPGDTMILTESATLYAVYIEGCTVQFRVGDSVAAEQVPPGGRPQQVPDLSGSGYTDWADASGKLADPYGEIWENQIFTAVPDTYTEPVPITLKNSNTHGKFMDGSDDGLFHPGSTLKRAELAQMLYAIVEQRPETGASFSDVAQDAWYAPAVEAMAGLGILEGYSDGTFRPAQAVTRAECAVAFARLIPYDNQNRVEFPDVPEDYWAYDEISRVGGYGLFQGDSMGNCNPDMTLKRVEAAVLFNRLLGHTPDAAVLDGADGLRVFPDVPTTYWGYSDIMEATISHESAADGEGGETWTSFTAEKTALADGYYRIGGWLYCVKDGMFLHGAAGQTYTDGVWTFDENGHYTTGNAELDQRLNDIVEKYTNSSMTRDEKLRALYVYIRDNYTYLARPYITKGQTGWEPEYALFFLQYGKGSCFSFSATYCLLCRELGQPAYTVVGGLGKNADPHGWVEIVLDGTRYMFDTQLEWRYLHDYGRSGYNLFKMIPGQTPFTYVW